MEQLELFHINGSPKRLTVSEAFDILWDLHLRYKKSGSTFAGNRKALCVSMGGKYIDSITEIDFRAHCANRIMGVAGLRRCSNTFHDHTLFHLLFSKMREWKRKNIGGLRNLHLPEENPTNGIKKHKSPKRKRTLTPNEFSNLVEHSDDNLADLLIFMLDTGMRLNDAMAIIPNNYNGALDLIEWTQSKTGKENSIPPTNRARRIITRDIKDKRTTIFDPVNLRKRFESAREKANIHNLQLGRDLRKTVYNLARQITHGPDIPRQIMGHASNRTGDDHYLIEDRKEVRPVIKQIEKIFSI